ncbi:MAG TPA: hypothetical protein QGF05_10610, partial [Dehalococcoidia bacterium]|nr:hypothetical protein [Dehalococcoidia bacterium]
MHSRSAECATEGDADLDGARPGVAAHERAAEEDAAVLPGRRTAGALLRLGRNSLTETPTDRYW